MKLIRIGNEIVNLDHVTKVKKENAQTVIYLTAMGGAEIANCVHVKGPFRGEGLEILLLGGRT